MSAIHRIVHILGPQPASEGASVPGTRASGIKRTENSCLIGNDLQAKS